MQKIHFLFLAVLIPVLMHQNHRFPSRTNAVDSQRIAVKPILPAANKMDSYLGSLHGKKIAIVANQASVVGHTNIVDTLLSRDINISCILSPEHGFRGDHADGELIDNQIDVKTGIPVISLYGNKKMPAVTDLHGIDMVVFDLQDVGARFYTYISTLTYIMQACAENGIPLLVLDRPNPNGYYVDGPVLQARFKSFVGMHPVPVVYGMTIGEYAGMVNGENWLDKGLQCKLTVITCENYTHDSHYKLPVFPSPNLRSAEAVTFYPSICLFEGTAVSVGRGTDNPFTLLGYPDYPEKKAFSFIPRSMPGISDNPPYKGQTCYGIDLLKEPKFIDKNNQINISYLIKMYKFYPEKSKYFNSYFDKLVGTDMLRNQIIKGLKESDIRKSWQPQINQFLKIRKKYLLYPDFRK